MLRVARRSAMKAGAHAANQIHAVIDTGPDELRHHPGSVNTEQIVAVTARFHRCFQHTPLDAAKTALRTLARRWQHLDEEIGELDAQLDDLTAAAAPSLRAINGVAPSTVSRR